MKTTFALLFSVALFLSVAKAQTAETWTRSNGESFEGYVKLVTPGTVIFTLPTGTDLPLEISKLSSASRKRLIAVLGLNAQATPQPAKPVAKAPLPTAPTNLPAIARAANAIDVTDIAMIDSQFGLKATVIGKVIEISSLGSTGHKRINFEGTDFYVFINKRQLESSTDWKLDGLAGRTIQVTGEITKFKDVLQIQIQEPRQIGLIEK